MHTFLQILIYEIQLIATQQCNVNRSRTLGSDSNIQNSPELQNEEASHEMSIKT